MCERDNHKSVKVQRNNVRFGKLRVSFINSVARGGVKGHLHRLQAKTAMNTYTRKNGVFVVYSLQNSNKVIQ